MSSYLEFDSSYRDRNRWPIAGEFEMPFSQTGRRDKIQALDPVCNSYPLTSWTSNRVDANTSGAQLAGGTIAAIAAPNNIGASTDGSVLTLVSAVAGDFQQADNYYAGLVFVDTTINIDRRIYSSVYLGVSSTGKDRMQITLISAIADTFALGNAFTINDPTDLSDPSVPLLFVPSATIADNAFIQAILYNETRNDYRTISSYDGATRILKLNATSNPIPGTWTVTDNYNIRLAAPSYVTTIDVAPVPTVTSITLVAGSSTIDDFYVGNFVRIRATTYGNLITVPQTQARKITAYNATTRVLTVTPSFTVAPTAGNTVEILEFTRDNLNPFSYSGSTVSQQQMVCYEIELLNLVLPNATLAVGYSGGRIAFYPYVYVELSNVSAPGAGLHNVIWSNNPNSTRALFRAAVNDIANPVFSTFIKLDGNGMVQQVKFKPNDTLKIKITLPDGQIYQTTIPEKYSPSAPEPRGQLSGNFLLRRLQ